MPRRWSSISGEEGIVVCVEKVFLLVSVRDVVIVERDKSPFNKQWKLRASLRNTARVSAAPRFLFYVLFFVMVVFQRYFIVSPQQSS